MTWILIIAIVYCILGLGFSFLIRGAQGGSVDNWKDRLKMMVLWPLFFIRSC